MSASKDLPVPTDIISPPIKILATHWRKTPMGRQEHVQVQWPAGDVKDVTWEDKIKLQYQFPDAMAWGHAKSQGAGDVNTTTDERDTNDAT
jgi:hypothetical protein